MRPMVAAVWLLAAATVVGAAVACGPTALDAWRFTEDIHERRSQTSAPEDRGAAIAVTCDHCHGANGNSRSDFYPALAGLPADYLFEQLEHFASGRRDSPHMRPLAIYLPQADLQAISAHYAKQKVELPQQEQDASSAPPANVRPAGVVARLQVCASCHGEALQGGARAPRLAGQGSAYLQRQLEAFHQGARKDPTGAMATFAQTLDPAEFGALAKAASAMRPTSP